MNYGRSSGDDPTPPPPPTPPRPGARFDDVMKIRNIPLGLSPPPPRAPPVRQPGVLKEYYEISRDLHPSLFACCHLWYQCRPLPWISPHLFPPGTWEIIGVWAAWPAEEGAPLVGGGGTTMKTKRLKISFMYQRRGKRSSVEGGGMSVSISVSIESIKQKENLPNINWPTTLILWRPK